MPYSAALSTRVSLLIGLLYFREIRIAYEQHFSRACERNLAILQRNAK
jgi:hypothetical protein